MLQYPYKFRNEEEEEAWHAARKANDDLLAMLDKACYPFGYQAYKEGLCHAVERLKESDNRHEIDDQFTLYKQLYNEFFELRLALDAAKGAAKGAADEVSGTFETSETSGDEFMTEYCQAWSVFRGLLDQVIPSTEYDCSSHDLADLVKKCADHPLGDEIQKKYELWFELDAKLPAAKTSGTFRSPFFNCD